MAAHEGEEQKMITLAVAAFLICIWLAVFFFQRMVIKQEGFNRHLFYCRDYSLRSLEAQQHGNKELAEFMLLRAKDELLLAETYLEKAPKEDKIRGTCSIKS